MCKDFNCLDCPAFQKNSCNIMTNQVIDEENTSILNMESQGEEAKKTFEELRIQVEVNLWDRIVHVKLKNWDELCQKTKLKSKEYRL